ncbi:zinc finger BED domain-containing protein RICESLEEPER 2-like [Solanum stenotomum]|uniref:zinc finger BED domain-containing protein RICESLEEPER 2-like n=1 Tax=Solanum stenotomum TaxID=172797 RepID=UPI0020D10155|nr:zinc finger BED domain-containing protein RICESLEEPER 2-like [Solanum stenotomum]
MTENIITDEVVVLVDESINSNATRQTKSVQLKVKKERKKRSRAWDHFGSFVDEEGNKKSMCKHCGADYFADSGKNGTTSMLTHMLTCPKMPRIVDKNQTQIGFKTVQRGDTDDVVVVSWKFEQEQCRKALCRMVIVDELPFKFVEKEGFRNFMKVTQPHFKIPSRTTVTRDCFKLFDVEKQKLRKSFGEAQQRVSLTTDTWTSLQRINYMCITAHWIDKEWMMHKRIISFCQVSSHRGEDMANEISKCLRDWGLDKIFTITVDNASSNDVTVKELSKIFTKRGTNFMNGEHLHVRCMAHILNLVVQDGLKVSAASIERVRKAVKYIRLSPARCKRFHECAEDVDINCKKSLCLDVCTRWNSTYLMLNRAIEFENVFSSYVDRDIGLLHYLQFVEDEDGTAAGALSSDDWNNVKKVADFLQIFYDLTREVSGSQYVTSNLHFLKICEVSCYLKKLIVSEDDTDDLLGKIAKNMREKFDKYCGTPNKMNKMIFISCVLDPRHKFVLVGFALQMMFGKEKGLVLEHEVRGYMDLMFGEYVKSLSKDKDSHHSSSLSSSSFEKFSSLPSSSDSTVQSIGSLGSFMVDLMKHKAGNATIVKTELQKYLGEENEVETKNFNILSWWKINSPRFPILAEMARNVLAIPISSVASECAFSTGGRILDSFRSSLTPKLVQTLVCLQDWIRSESRHVSVEEDIDVLEQLEQAFLMINMELKLFFVAFGCGHLLLKIVQDELPIYNWAWF